MIILKNRPPVIRVESLPSGKDPNKRIIIGKAVSELQIPGEKIFVDVIYFHEGSPQKIDVPVTPKTDEKTGICYFEFETAVQGLLEIPADDPRYSAPFFGFKITDQAGNSYYQEQSYAKYMAPGASRFGFSDLAMISVEKLPEADEFKNIIRLTPAQLPLQNQLASGEPVIIIEVTGSTKTSRLVKIRSNVKNRLPMTLVLRDEKQLGMTRTDEYIDSEKLRVKTAEYRVEQEDADGVRYTSNTVPVSDFEFFILTVRSNVYDDMVYIDGVKRGSTRLDVKLEKGKHKLSVEKERYEAYKKEIDLHKDETVWAELKTLTETLQVETDPTGATVFVNDEKKGVSPLKLTVTGKIRLHTELTGYKPESRVVDFPPESPELRLKLKVLPCKIFVTTEPSDALIQFRNFSEKFRQGMEVKGGTYYLEISKRGYVTESRILKVSSGKITRIEVKLKSEVTEVKGVPTKIPNQKGLLFVITEPPDVHIQFKNINETYKSGMELDPGTYMIEISKKGYETENRSVKISAGQVTPTMIELKLEEKEPINEALPKQKGRLSLSVTPSNARVRLTYSIDKRGISLLNDLYSPEMELNPGKYFIEVSKKGYETANKIVKINAGMKSEIEVELKIVVKVTSLRSESKRLSKKDVRNMIRKYNFFSKKRDLLWDNPDGDFKNYFIDNDDKAVTDKATSLMWEKTGSSNMMLLKNTQDYIDKLNKKKFAGHSDWRLPTLEELASLLESKKVKDCFIDPVFDCKGHRYWSVDRLSPELVWCVHFDSGNIYWSMDLKRYVRAVRSYGDSRLIKLIEQLFQK
ncbi:MAG: PEGA domain-containing protein [Desulfobacterales bacterium]|nr:PEGA domain-containing protein [Desulfobacterales bacterium]